MSELDEARTLMDAGDRDLSALRGMEDTSVFADEIVGFHVQQAAEKFLKAWLVLWSEPYPLTHNLARLLTRRRLPSHNFAISTSTRLTRFSSVTTPWSPNRLQSTEKMQSSVWKRYVQQVRRRLAEVEMTGKTNDDGQDRDPEFGLGTPGGIR